MVHKKITNQNIGGKMGKLNIVDLIALATVKPELFTKKHLALVLKVKNKIMDQMFKELTKKEAA